MNRKLVLIVEDDETSIDVLVGVLKPKCELAVTTTGDEALAYIRRRPVDLVLLDIRLPGIDGYEVCNRMKRDRNLREIPVIFITALTEISDKTRGFEVGAVDYITKPFEPAEVMARVQTHLTLAEQERQLKIYARDLQLMVEEKTRQLIRADRFITLGLFVSALAHEIRSPLMSISASADTLLVRWQAHFGGSGESATDSDVVFPKLLTTIREGTDRISGLLRNIGEFVSPQVEWTKEYPLVNAVESALSILHHRLKRGIRVVRNVPADLRINCDPQAVVQVFVNLVDNAVDADAAGGREARIIRIDAHAENEQLVVTVKDNGPGVPESLCDRIFDPFFTTKEKDKGTGLGLFIVKSIIERHAGHIEVLPWDGTGAAFRFTWPLRGKTDTEIRNLQ